MRPEHRETPGRTMGDQDRMAADSGVSDVPSYFPCVQP